LICCAPAGSEGGAVWALNASTGTVLNNGLPIITTAGPIRVPPTIDGNWIFVLDNNGDMYGLTIDPSYAAISAKARAIDARVLKRWEAPPTARSSGKAS
jgi:outer membrane protein assembly factor BamB